MAPTELTDTHSMLRAAPAPRLPDGSGWVAGDYSEPHPGTPPELRNPGRVSGPQARLSLKRVLCECY